MARPAHTRLTLSGRWGTSGAVVERWSFNLNFPAALVPNNMSDPDVRNLAADVGAPAQGFIESAFGADVVLTEIRLAAVGADGHVPQRADGTYVQGIVVREWDGGMAKQPMPLQVALCVSLTTQRPGPTGKGRFYVPWPAISLDADDKRIPQAQAVTFSEQVQDFLNGVQTAAQSSLQVVSSKGYMTEVTGLRIGRVPDTMRSRRDDSIEGYVTLPLD